MKDLPTVGLDFVSLVIEVHLAERALELSRYSCRGLAQCGKRNIQFF